MTEGTYVPPVADCSHTPPCVNYQWCVDNRDSEKPMTLDELANWLVQRGVKSGPQLDYFVRIYAGKTESEMDRLYAEMHNDPT